MGSNNKKVAITGAQGSLAHDIIPTISSSGWDVIGIDSRAVDGSPRPDIRNNIQNLTLDILKTTELEAALRDCDALIHLAGIPLEDDWENIVDANIRGTQSVLEAARKARVRRVVLASSIHALGGTSLPVDPREIDSAKPRSHQEFIPADAQTFPTTFYGVSKVALEALGQMYAFRHGLEVLCIRIASRFEKPLDERMLSTWLSPRDAANLMLASINTSVDSPFTRIWGVSNNLRNYLSLDAGNSIGFTPLDNAETVADDEILQQTFKERSSWEFTLGGVFSSPNPPRMKNK